MAFTWGGYMDPSTGRLGDPNQIPDFQAPKYGSSTGPVSPSGGPYVQAAPQGPAPRGSQGPAPRGAQGPAPMGAQTGQFSPGFQPNARGSGFSLGPSQQAIDMAFARQQSVGGIDPRLKESLAKNAMIGDLFGGYSEWRDQGSPDLGNMWQKYLPVSRAYAASEDVDFDRLRSQGDLRGLPSREKMLAQLGIGQQAPQQQAPQMGPGSTDQPPSMNPNPPQLNPQAPSYQNYQPWNANWVYNNIYGGGGWQPPGNFNPQPFTRPDSGWSPGGGAPAADNIPNGMYNSQGAPARNFPIGPEYLNQFGSNLFGSQTASTSPSVTGTQFSSGKGGPGGKGGSGGFKGGTTQPIRRGGYT